MEGSIEHNKMYIDRETLEVIIKRLKKETARKVIKIRVTDDLYLNLQTVNLEDILTGQRIWIIR